MKKQENKERESENKKKVKNFPRSFQWEGYTVHLAFREDGEPLETLLLRYLIQVRRDG